MKCINTIPCDGEMQSYEGIQEGCIECVKCGFRTDAPKTKAAKKADVILPTENKGENN